MCPMSPRLLRPRASGPTHPEARDWIARVTANGGTVGSSTARAVDQFCRSIDAESGLRAAILRLNLFAGENLSAALVPLYRGASLTGTQLGNTTDTNVNFVSGDYQATGSNGGLKGNGSSKYLNTGFSTSLLSSQTSTHLSVSGISFDAAGGGNQTFIGSDVGTASQVFSLDENMDYLGDVRGFRSGSGFPLGNVASTTVRGDETHFIGTRTSSTENRLYRNGSQVTLNTASLTPTSSTQAVFVFAIPSSGSPVSYSSGRLRMYSIGNGLTAAQALAFSNAVNAFNAAIGRVPPQVSNADAQDWITRAYANGGTVSTTTANAVNTFCNDINTAGIRDRFYRLNLFCGTGLPACLVPLYRNTSLSGGVLGLATDANSSFVSGDYAETGSSGGLKGNASNKYLNTGVTFASAPVATLSLSVYAAEMETSAGTNANFGLIGSLNSSGSFHGAALSAAWNFSSNDRRCDFIGGSGQAVPAITSGILAAAHLAASNTSGTDFKLFQNGSAVATATATVGTASNNTVGAILVFARNNANSAQANPVFYTGSRMRAYHIGQSMTDAQQLAFYNAMQTFQTALSRNV